MSPFDPQDDELDEETKNLLDSAQDEDAILKSPTVSNASNSPDEPPPPIINEAKKISLKRKIIVDSNETLNTPVAIKRSEPSAVGALPVASTAATSETTDNDDAGKVKSSELTLEQRLEMRAKKFGTPLSSDALKLARAERFGIKSAPAAAANGSSGNSASTITKNAPAANVDVLKKRAERFGGSVSTVMNTIEQKEKLNKRQERFGTIAASTTTKVSAPATTAVATAAATPATPTTASTEVASSNKVDYAEKARLRLERFKTAVN